MIQIFTGVDLIEIERIATVKPAIRARFLERIFTDRELTECGNVDSSLAGRFAAKEAVDRARSGGGPTLIECVTYRMAMHTTADDPKKYRAEEEVELWKKRDPITRFQKYLVEKGLLSEDKIAGMESEIMEEIQAAIDQAEAQMKTFGDPMDMFEHVYAEMSPYLKEQKEAFAGEIAEMKEEGNHG